MLREFLRDTFAYIQPAAVLADLSAEDATRRLDGAPHTPAEILAHMDFWQSWFLARCRGEAAPMVAAAAHGWRAVGADEWTAVRDRFLRGLDDAVSMSEDRERVMRSLSPAIDFPPLAEYTVHDALSHIALHNAHHLGQIVTLRQMMGRWPPPSGSWTW